jgi:hypothetical protein
VLTLAAEIRLYQADLLDKELEPTWHGLLSRAAAYVEEALDVGQAANDAEGLLLNELARAHLDQLRAAIDGITPGKRIRAVLKQARRMSDDSLVTEAQISLGYDLLARGKLRGARQWFIWALRSAQRIGAPGLAFLAEREVRRLNERGE